jgi:hypothetical protein
LEQPGWKGTPLREKSWEEAVSQRIDQISFEQAVVDVAPFIEPGAGLELLTRENLRRLLSRASSRPT